MKLCLSDYDRLFENCNFPQQLELEILFLVKKLFFPGCLHSWKYPGIFLDPGKPGNFLDFS